MALPYVAGAVGEHVEAGDVVHCHSVWGEGCWAEDWALAPEPLAGTTRHVCERLDDHEGAHACPCGALQGA